MGCIAKLLGVAILLLAFVVGAEFGLWPGLIVGFVGVLFFLTSSGKVVRCQICGNVLNKTRYTWKIDGKRRIACPHCNRSLEREKSRSALS